MVNTGETARANIAIHFGGLRYFRCPKENIHFGNICHVGTSYARSDVLFHKKSVIRSTVPPFPQKVTLRLRCSLASALTTLWLATNFLRFAPSAYSLFFVVPFHIGAKLALFRFIFAPIGHLPALFGLWEFHSTSRNAKIK